MTLEAGLALLITGFALFVVCVVYSVSRTAAILAKKAEADWNENKNQGPYGTLPKKNGPYSPS